MNGGAFTKAGSSTTFQSTDFICVGNQCDGGSPLYGDIDQLAMWLVELTIGNAIALYNTGAGLPLP